MAELRAVYAQKAISQIPRLLSFQDRNPFSPTYGCFDRVYWLDKAIDFPSSVYQFAVHTLALAYAYPFPDNPYYQQANVREWCIAGMDYWTRIQHSDGSFDEFYPAERGWSGPTGETLYAVLATYELLHDEIPADVRSRVLRAARKAADYIVNTRQAGGVLANHHAMAVLAVQQAHRVLGDADLAEGADRLWQEFLKHHHPEGWSTEYDGADPGYLSATISSLAKVYRLAPRDELRRVMEEAVEFASYFVYPDGSFGGSIGSRNTYHCYCHGFELLAPEMPLAAAIAERLLRGLAEGQGVPPEIMADRYCLYRTQEYLLSYLDWRPRSEPLPELPYERKPFRRYFVGAGIIAQRTPAHYIVANLAKGGVVKAFDVSAERLVFNDCGLIGTLLDGKIVSSQWIDPAYDISVQEDKAQVLGHLHYMPAAKVFDPLKMLLFRAVLILIGWSTRLSHWMKGAIRRQLMLGTRPAPLRFRRTIRVEAEGLMVEDQIDLEKGVQLRSLAIGGEFAVRYVPQSRYYQAHDLRDDTYRLEGSTLDTLHMQRSLMVTRRLRGREVHVVQACSPSGESGQR